MLLDPKHSGIGRMVGGKMALQMIKPVEPQVAAGTLVNVLVAMNCLKVVVQKQLMLERAVKNFAHISRS